MEVTFWDGFGPLPSACRHAALSIGNFDGVHKGHAALLRRLHRLKTLLNCPGIVATFDPPPLRLLRPEMPLDVLTTLEEKIALLNRFSLDRVLVFRTTPELLSLTADAFWRELLIERLQIRGLVEGTNFFFGKKREGSVELLRQWSKEEGVELEIVHDVFRRGQKISSTLIRDLLKEGQVAQARRALGRPYFLTGRVILGDQRGRQLGFPTANLTEIPTLIPGVGVYAATARVGETHYAAAINIGPNPTFGVQSHKVEAHLLDFNGDLYGTSIRLEFYARLRSTQPFASVAGLKEQLALDIAQTRQLIQPLLEVQP
jgi:riboflavin kinase/FMN adenylyltransferase